MEHYSDLKERPFFPHLVNFMSSGPVVAMVRPVIKSREIFTLMVTIVGIVFIYF